MCILGIVTQLNGIFEEKGISTLLTKFRVCIRYEGESVRCFRSLACHISRNRRIVEKFMSDGYNLTVKESDRLEFENHNFISIYCPS